MGRKSILQTKEKKYLVKKLRKIIENSGYQKKYVAEWCGMSGSTLSNILAGVYNMPKARQNQLNRFIIAKIDRDFDIESISN